MPLQVSRFLLVLRGQLPSLSTSIPWTKGILPSVCVCKQSFIIMQACPCVHTLPQALFSYNRRAEQQRPSGLRCQECLQSWPIASRSTNQTSVSWNSRFSPSEHLSPWNTLPPGFWASFFSSFRLSFHICIFPYTRSYLLFAQKKHSS